MRERIENKAVMGLLLFVYILLILPFLGNIAFDAVVHFKVAENFASGHPFKYNLADTENVIASTSPFWTMLLTFFYFISGQFAPLLVKSVCILLWLSCGYLLNIISRDVWKMDTYFRYAVLLMWFANVSIVKNSLGGLENILSAFQLLLLYYMLWKNLTSTDNKINFYIGALTVWALLTRPDGGILAVVMVIIFLICRKSFVKEIKVSLVKSIFIIAVTGAIILLPWYIYQYSLTSQILSDSSLARVYTGRRNSITLLNGLIYFHPSAITALLTALLPVSIGFLVTLLTTFKTRIANTGNRFHLIAAIAMVICSVGGYTFAVGADQFGRYFLSAVPFFLVAGFYGMQKIYISVKEKNISAAKVFAGAIIIFLVAVNVYDYYKRVVTIGQLESDIYESFYAPCKRKEVTDAYLRRAGFNENDTMRLAITEVQFKYFVDERINILSLDGRSSPAILKYMSKEGIPDFERFIENEKPDVMEVKGWAGVKPNLLSEWEEKLKGMNIGDSFEWRGKKINYFAPWHVRIIK